MDELDALVRTIVGNVPGLVALAGLLLALIGAGAARWWQRYRRKRKQPVEADRDADLLRDAGRRLRRWEDGARARGRPDEDRPRDTRAGVRDERR